MAHDSPNVAGRPDGPGPVDRPERLRRPDQPRRVDAPVGAVLEPYQRRLDQPITPGGDTPREAIRRFDPERAGLEPITREETKQYVRDNVADRPWLKHAQYVGADTCRVLAAIDKGGGHSMERHGSPVTPEMTDGRAGRLEDPAIPDQAARTPGRDAYKSGRHVCGVEATRIRDPHAFATCFVRGVEHPDVRSALEQPCGPGAERPDLVEVPLAELLGPDGHTYCDGYRLEPVNGSDREAVDRRKAWVDAIRQGQEPAVPEPQTRRLEAEDFVGAKVVFAFQRNAAGTAWEITTMYVNPERQTP